MPSTISSPRRARLPGAEDAPVLFRDFAARWLRTEVVLPCERETEGALAPSSVRQRENTLRIYLLPYFGSLDVRKIRVADVQCFYDERIEGCGGFKRWKPINGKSGLRSSKRTPCASRAESYAPLGATTIGQVNPAT